jgi:MICOS complex subunit MIC26
MLKHHREKRYASSTSSEDCGSDHCLQFPERKPIYSDYATLVPKPKPSDTSPVSKPSSTSPTPTDRVTGQVRKARLFLYDQTLAAENVINHFMSYVLDKETSFTNTIASLAPARETGEQLLPGAIYVLVATMTGSIITRNRGLFLRTTFPLAVGIAAGWVLIPVTMRNIADLSWEYEKKVPLISNTHAEVSGFTKEAWRQTKVHAKLVADWADEKAAAGRDKAESWVRDGK